MRLKLAGLALVVMLLSAFIVAPISANAAAPAKTGLTQKVGEVATSTGVAEVYLTVTSFAKKNGGIVANGTATVVQKDLAGNTVATASQPVVDLPVQSINGQSVSGYSATNAASTFAAGSCDILSLTLGPLHLDLLGLVIDLNQVNLNITAQQGAGNLLGNLLCAVANLLNGGSPLQNLLGSLTNLLNQILGAL